jgi:hypothetical protein
MNKDARTMTTNVAHSHKGAIVCILTLIVKIPDGKKDVMQSLILYGQFKFELN